MSHKSPQTLGTYRMSAIRALIEDLRDTEDLAIHNQTSAWLILVRKDHTFVCEIVVPFDVLEWFASIKAIPEGTETWSDWMDYSDYDSTSRRELEFSMAADIRDFISRRLQSDLSTPIPIFKENA